MFSSNKYYFKSLKLCKYDPTINTSPLIITFYYQLTYTFPMLLDELFWVQECTNGYFAFRRSCREGICGSCAMNINGVNSLACLYQLSPKISTNVVLPLAHMPIVRDLIVSLRHFYLQYQSIEPWVHVPFNKSSDMVQLEVQRALLDGLYECILCACCSTSCPSYWWNSDSYLGPAILLQALRWIMDSRDAGTLSRLTSLNDTFKLYRCHSILNCTHSCPKGLNPALAISAIKKLISNLSV